MKNLLVPHTAAQISKQELVDCFKRQTKETCISLFLYLKYSVKVFWVNTKSVNYRVNNFRKLITRFKRDRLAALIQDFVKISSFVQLIIIKRILKTMRYIGISATI